MDLVYSNSCSFGAPGQGHQIYSNVVSDQYSSELVNRGERGACNRRIIRTTLRDLTDLKEAYNDILVLIGFTFLSRTETWRPDLPAAGNDGHFHSLTVNHSKIDWTNGLNDTIVTDIHKLADPEVSEYYKQWLLHYDREAAMTDLLTDIVMLAGWLKQNNINYLMFSNVDCFDGDDLIGYNSPFLNNLRLTVEQDPCIINPWNFSFGTYALENGHEPKDARLYGKHGHPGEQAHQMFGNYLLEYLNGCT
jgi:hypothetical protein